MVSELKKMQELSIWAEHSFRLILHGGLVSTQLQVPNIKTLRISYFLNIKQLKG